MNVGEKHFCSKCMRETEEYGVCPHCGFDPDAPVAPFYIEEGTLFQNGRYELGAVIGQGGFGITYAAWDTVLDIPVAIKEYFPTEYCKRDAAESDEVEVTNMKQISDYACRLNIKEDNPEKKVDDFIRFLPVLAYDGSTMKQINAQDVLDIALAGTSATLLAKRWESALLVNVDNETLKRLLANKSALDALMHIEGFRSLNEDIQTIINKSETVKKVKKEGEGKLTPNQKKVLSEEEKEYKSMRRQIQDKLIKFATRIPVFMYLTDYRERTLKDVITQIESGLFKKVTGLEVSEFETLCPSVCLTLP